MEKNAFFQEYVFRTSLVVFLTVLALSVAERQYGLCSSKKTSNQCGSDKFQCFDGGCIPSSKYCNGYHDCRDRSDERYCRLSNYEHCPNSPRRFIRCSGSPKCIPEEWRCDGSTDCPSGDDERNCSTAQLGEYSANFVNGTKTKAIDWLLKRAVPASATRKWGPLVHKTAVAFYLSDPTFLSNDSSVRKEITYELSIQLLSRISQKKLQGISSSELASFINAFLVTCTDPSDFNGFNLVEELRSRVDKQNYTNPYLLLTLCNAGDAITVSDVEKLLNIFWNNNREIPTDSQAIVLMAISCARNQTDSVVDEATVKELALELKQRQYRNGTVENLHTTLLVMQALYAAEADEDLDNFDEKKALSFILQNQKPDGSFGNFLLTYYALPLLNCRSMINITSSHCEKVRKDEETFVFDLVNYVGPKISIRYSIWFGKETDIGRTLSVKVPTNTSFYRAMEIAADIDSRYRFEYVVKNRKPYITAVSGTLDDPESETFWFPYIIKDEKPTLLQKSTADVRLKNSDHIIMWYREGSWAE